MRRYTILLLALGTIGLALTFVALLHARRGSAAPTGQAACLPSSQIPGTLPSRAADDCYTGVITSVSGTIVAGTFAGHVVVQTGASTQASTIPSSSGPVSDLKFFSVAVDNPRQFVALAVDQGVVVFDPSSGTPLALGGTHPLFDVNSDPIADASVFIDAGTFIRMRPVAGRPHLNALGQYALTKPDGAEEALIVSGGASSVCALYIPAPGWVPERSWCADVSDLVPWPTPQPALPRSGGGCPESTDVKLDPSHTIHVTLTRTSISPAHIDLIAGEPYVVILTIDDPGVAHSLAVVDAAGTVLRDANDAVLCLAATAGAVVSGQFVAPTTPGTAYVVDPIHPNIPGAITNILPAGPANSTPTGSPSDVSTLTPVAPSLTPTATAQSSEGTAVPSRTPAPVLAMPEP